MPPVIATTPIGALCAGTSWSRAARARTLRPGTIGTCAA